LKEEQDETVFRFGMRGRFGGNACLRIAQVGANAPVCRGCPWAASNSNSRWPMR
jgi:hypothetical protein